MEITTEMVIGTAIVLIAVGGAYGIMNDNTTEGMPFQGPWEPEETEVVEEKKED